MRCSSVRSRSRLSPPIQYDELDLHINDDAFIDDVVDELVTNMNRRRNYDRQ